MESPAFDSWKRVERKSDGKMNLKNIDTDELLSDMWFDWVGYLIDGYAIVSLNNKGYNLIDANGDIVLPEWHEDIEEPLGDGEGYTIVDGKERSLFNPAFEK